DLVRITKHDPPGLRKHEIPPDVGEEFRSQGLLQRAKLPADRWLGQVQLRAGPGDGSLASHRPEVEQMVVVEPSHPAEPTSVFSMFQVTIFDLFKLPCQRTIRTRARRGRR